MRVYVSGNYYKASEQWLKCKGYEIINPCQIIDQLEMLTDAERMRLRHFLIDCADAVFMTCEWQDNEVANNEIAYAKSLGKKIVYEGYYRKRSKIQ